MEVQGIGVLRNTLAAKVGYDPNYRYKPAPSEPPAPGAAL